MLASPAGASLPQTHSAEGGDQQQLQDLESLAQRLRALEVLLAPTVASKATGRASGGGDSPGEEAGGEDAPVDAASNLVPSLNGSHSDRELLTLQAKTELILAAQEELQKLAEESKEIQNLQRCAEIGGLKNVESQYPVLSQLETVHIDQCQESNKISDRMNKLTDDYNSLINTLSAVFLSWDALLTAAEIKVSEVERARN
ncbi:hypothetical protein BGZ70_005140 [Mortierella alpina]|uniref:Uncharacterized protein n=1 Tax=Mortierella alpina TaxID=64518 RepID=A0A9P6J9P6_MORAP|nr:hypothetical protein BGZ70_005140 [Mortierella alpina]